MHPRPRGVRPASPPRAWRHGLAAGLRYSLAAGLRLSLAAGLRLPLAAWLVLALAGCGGGGGTPAKPRRGGPIPVETAPVASRELAYLVEGTGSLEAYQVVTVPARVDGVVEKVAFDEGDEVDPGRELAVVDGTRRALDLAEAEAALARAEAAVPRTAAALERALAGIERAAAVERGARNDLRESEEMLQRREAVAPSMGGAVSVEEVATLRAQVGRRRELVAVAEAAQREAASARAEAQAQRAEAEAAVAEARAKLDVARRTAQDTVVRPPLKGVVRRRHVTLGQYVAAGDAVAELVDRSRLRLRFRVTEPESVRLARDMPVRFRVPSLADAEHPAVLVHVDETASPITRMVECLAEVSDPDPALRPGFYATAAVETRTARAIAVPESALQPGEQGWVAWVVEGDRARQRPVLLGLRTRDGLAEILDGLKEGDVLVVRGGRVLHEGAAVDARARGAAPEGAAVPGGSAPGGASPAQGGTPPAGAGR